MDLHVTPAQPLRDVAFKPTAPAKLLAPWASFAERLTAATGQRIENPAQLHEFSVRNSHDFWRHFLGWADLHFEGDAERFCAVEPFDPGAAFPDLRLNYAENLLRGRGADPHAIAITVCQADGRRVQITRAELRQRVEQMAEVLREHGVGVGDRVVAILRNDADAVTTALAVAAIGASLCSAAPGTSASAMLECFEPLAPRLMIAHMAGAVHDSGEPLATGVAQVAASLASLNLLLTLDEPPLRLVNGPPVQALTELLVSHSGARFLWQRFAFDQPLLRLASSNLSGSNECTLHAAGALLLEHVRSHLLDGGLHQANTLDVESTCGSVTWHWQLSALATGCAIVMRDGTAKKAGSQLGAAARAR